MALNGNLHIGGQRLPLLPALSITAAGTVITTPVVKLSGMNYLTVQAAFVYGSGGTSADAYVQTSLDGGASWIDIMNFHFLLASAVKVSAVTAFIAPGTQAFAPTDGSLTANTINQGVLGDRVRVKMISVGTYAGTTLQLDATAKG